MERFLRRFKWEKKSFGPEIVMIEPNQSEQKPEIGSKIEIGKVLFLSRKGTVIKMGNPYKDGGIYGNACGSRNEINCPRCPYPPEYCEAPKKPRFPILAKFLKKL